VVTGDFDRDEILRLARSFRGGQARPVSRPTLGIPFRTSKPSSSEVNIRAYQVKLETPHDAAVARVAAALLDDELWRRFRQAGLAYSYTAAPLRSAWLDLLAVIVPARDPSSLPLSGYLAETVDRVRAGAFDDLQLARAKRAAQASLAADDRSPPALAQVLANGGVTWHGRAVADELLTLDRSALVAELGRWLAPDRSLVIYLGPTP